MLKGYKWTWIVVAILGIACSEEAADSGNGTSSLTDAAVGDVIDSDATAPVDVVEDPTFEVGNFCLESTECPGQWCDKDKGGCVDCYLNEHCSDDEVCLNGECVQGKPCASGAECPDAVCLESGMCGECDTDDECAGSFVCKNNVCGPAGKECENDEACKDQGSVCDQDQGNCVDCKDSTQCAQGEVCDEGTCVPSLCTPGEQVCNGNMIQVCRADGKGVYFIACENGLACLNGQCLDVQCTPGEKSCLQHQAVECNSSGVLVVKNCPPNQECLEGECAPMRQRVLVIFDTSGSMNAIAEKKEWPNYCGENTEEDCLTPWPECEPKDDPFTVGGISKKVFSQFFKSDDTENVLFGLQRFPQRAASSAPVCEGGYFEGDTLMTNDPGAHTIPLGINTFMDTYLHEIVLVEFPKETDSSNLLSLIQWLDFKETLFETSKTCFGPTECDQGVCLGPIGNKKCHTFTNPELRAHGWTPLGQSLFYAGEYLRRSVVVDGKPCTTDTDCGSPGYYCNEVGKCFDPLKECRLNVIVLFTDGGETVHPFTNSFFNPAVQAKRLRYGLGCETDDDCSAIPYCRPKQLEGQSCDADADCLLNDYDCNVALGICEHKEDVDCFQARCDTEGGPFLSYCTNDLIEDMGAPAITLTDNEFFQDRLLDYNGNPITAIVNVVDASISASDLDENDSTITLTNNYQIALHGGGLHVVVSVEDEADFLAKLKASIDPKSLYEQCSF